MNGDVLLGMGACLAGLGSAFSGYAALRAARSSNQSAKLAEASQQQVALERHIDRQANTPSDGEER